MSTANKLLYLGETKSKIKDVANMTGAGIDNNTTFRNYAQALYDGYINVLKDRNTLLDNMPKLTSTGSISEGLGLPIYEDKMSKLSTQDGTPTPENPVEVKTVKGYRNLFDKNDTSKLTYFYISNNNNYVNKESNGRKSLYISCKPNTKYVITKSSGYIFKVASTNVAPERNISLTPYIRTNDTASIAKITTDANANYLLVTYYYTGHDTLTEQEILDSIMIIEGDQELPYVPYGTNWIYTTITGKNLFNIQKMVKGRLDSGVIGYASNTTNLTLNENDFSFTTNANYRGVTSDYIEVKQSTEYVYKQKTIMTGLSYTSACYDENKNYLGSATTVSLNDYSKKYTMLANTKYFRLNVQLNSSGTITIEEPQLEEGNQATTYEAYKEKIITLPLNNNEIAGIGDYKDEYIVDKNGHCWLNKKTGKSVLNGSENDWEYQSNSRWPFRIVLDDILPFTNTVEQIPQNILCNYFSVSYWNNTDNNGTFTAMKDYNKRIAFANTATATLADWKTWLSTHNTEVYYVLATENLIDLNYNVDIRLFNGINNITNSEDMDMAIKYIKDTYE